MTSKIDIDLRMYGMSGIGRYLQIVLPEVLPHLVASSIRVFCDPEDVLGEPWLEDARVEICDFRVPIFSVSEQIGGNKRFWKSQALWVPQYNIPLLYRNKLIVTIHDVCQLAYPESLSSGLQRWYARHLLTTALNRSTAILCVSEFTRREIARLLGADKAPIFVIHPGSGMSPRRTGKPLALPTGKSYFLAVGNIKKHKNLGRLLDAFASIQDHVPHDLVLVGKQEGMLNADFGLTKNAAVLGDRVRFTGLVSDDELQTFYRNAVALIFPSFYEGFGFPVLEAMAQGCPVACSNAASLPEIAEDAALFFDPHNSDSIAGAMMRISTDNDLRRELISKGLQRVQLFDARIAGRKTADVINAVLNGAPANIQM
ncbi:MAG TPA: glycosyltransferase family 1 protein [Acidobacteriaceae bacterium]|nr:glycosyltransferase family 1 protein [Acidobacteriaceae bacterium]